MINPEWHLKLKLPRPSARLISPPHWPDNITVFNLPIRYQWFDLLHNKTPSTFVSIMCNWLSRSPWYVIISPSSHIAPCTQKADPDDRSMGSQGGNISRHLVPSVTGIKNYIFTKDQVGLDWFLRAYNCLRAISQTNPNPIRLGLK